MRERSEISSNAQSNTGAPADELAEHETWCAFRESVEGGGDAPCDCGFDLTQARRAGVDQERARWTEAARIHAGAWSRMGTPGGEIIASDYLMWAATMQPVSPDGTRPFKLDLPGLAS